MFREDLRVFFNTDEFAVEAFIRGIVVKGMEGWTYSTVNQVHCCKRTFICAQARSPLASIGDRVVIRDQSYQIVEAKPDGTGLLMLVLELVT
jgi:hypothetical protein